MEATAPAQPSSSPAPQLHIVKEVKDAQPAEKPLLLERVVLNRKAREVRFYLRQNTYKKCVHNLTDEQVKKLLTAIKKSGKDLIDTLSFADETFIVSPKTKRLIE
jgi:hypothetical protein